MYVCMYCMYISIEPEVEYPILQVPAPTKPESGRGDSRFISESACIHTYTHIYIHTHTYIIYIVKIVLHPPFTLTCAKLVKSGSFPLSSAYALRRGGATTGCQVRSPFHGVGYSGCWV